jgi:hypothetical protein
MRSIFIINLFSVINIDTILSKLNKFDLGQF